MNCPYCGQELDHIDYFGNSGEIYKCTNQECDSEFFDYMFHTANLTDELQEGSPV